MGICASKAGVENKASGKLDAQLKSDNKKSLRMMKLLLLGAGESGKSTIAKQMKILHKNGFTDEERQDYIEVIRQQCVGNTMDLLQGMKTLNLDITEEPLVMEVSNTVRDLIACNTVTSEHVGVLEKLWQHPSAQEAFAHRARFQIADTAAHFFDNISKVASETFLPTDEDILACRVRSTGIAEIDFEMEGVPFKMIDVGGQRNERRKWIHHFDGVQSVIFVTSLSEFDQVLFEDTSTNRMIESISVFSDVLSSRFFESTSVILFLNKRDLLKKKLAQGASIKACFPDYTGTQDYTEVVEFIKKKFMEQRKTPSQLVYAHTTCATDSANVAHVFNDVKDTVFQSNLISSGLM